MDAPKSQVFINRYYLEPNLKYVGLSNSELYNEAILVLDNQAPTDSNSPYIKEMDDDKLDLLMSNFSNYPVHKTNRITIRGQNKESLSELISSYIKPKVMITFSPETGSYIRSNFQIEYESHLRNTDVWKGIVRMNNKCFFLYSIPNMEQKEETSKAFMSFILSSAVFDVKTCHQLNEIIKRHPDFRLPANPLALNAVRKNLMRINELGFFSLPNLLPTAVTFITNTIKDFDIYDLVMIYNTTDWYPEKNDEHILSKEDYIELRKYNSSIDICSKYLDDTQIRYKRDIMMLSLIRFYLYMEYPKISFDAQWAMEKEYIKETTDVIQGFENAYHHFIANN